MFREKVIECCRSWRQILRRRHQPQPGARQRSVIFPFVTMADGEPPDSLGNAFLGLTCSIAPHINPCQANVVCVSEFCNCIAALLHRRVAVYDKDREGHYNLISALHKALRGSDPSPCRDRRRPAGRARR